MQILRLTEPAQHAEFNAACRRLIGSEYSRDDLARCECYGALRDGRLVAGWLLDPGAHMYRSQLAAADRERVDAKYGADACVGVHGWWMDPELKGAFIRFWVTTSVVRTILASRRPFMLAGSTNEKIFEIYRGAHPCECFTARVTFADGEKSVRIAMGRMRNMGLGFAVHTSRRWTRSAQRWAIGRRDRASAWIGHAATTVAHTPIGRSAVALGSSQPVHWWREMAHLIQPEVAHSGHSGSGRDAGAE